jgi:hypothetical protein
MRNCTLCKKKMLNCFPPFIRPTLSCRIYAGGRDRTWYDTWSFIKGVCNLVGRQMAYVSVIDYEQHTPK